MAKFVYPDYKNRCFSNIPSTVLSLFGIKTSRPTLPPETYRPILKHQPLKVILFLIDGLGFNAWQKYGKDYEAFRLIQQKGLVSPLTAVFPSTTASALTTIYSGLTPQEHGLFEWFVYFPEVGKIIATLPFSLPGENDPDSLLKHGFNPKILFSGKTIFQTLKEANITSYSFLNQDYGKSSYSKLIGKGSNIIPYKNAQDLILKLTEAIKGFPRKAYFYVYWDGLDHAAHGFGPGSKEYLNEMKRISTFITTLLRRLNQKGKENTILIITADHGEININPEKTIFLDKFKGIEELFETNPAGEPILPFGNPRDVFLHIKPKKLTEGIKFLQNKIGNKAKILKTREAIKMGLFGLGKPSKEFLARVGNLLILPYKNNTVWYQYPKVAYPNFLGHHGGLSEDEMLIPFAILNLASQGHPLRS